MRRKNESEVDGNGAGHIKFRVIEFEIDGGNDTLAEGIKALTTALSKSPATTTVVSPQRALPAATTPKRAAGATAETEPRAQGDFFASSTAEEPVEEAPTEETSEASTTPSARPKRTPSPPPVLEILSDIDLSTGKVSLRDFVAQKNPSDTYEKFATIAVWYKENHNLEEVNANRIYTAYRFLDWVPPTDVPQALRNLKASKKWFDKGDSVGGYKINMLGLNKVLEGFGE